MKCKGVVGPHLGNAFQHLIALFGFEDAPPSQSIPLPPSPINLLSPPLFWCRSRWETYHKEKISKRTLFTVTIYVHSLSFKTKKTYVVL